MTKSARVREDQAPERTPLHEQKRDLMTVAPRKGFVPRWFNDYGGTGQRIEAAKKGGWVLDERAAVAVGDDSVENQNQTLGSGARKYVGGGMSAVLMWIRQDWYDEDREALADKVAAKEKAIFRGEGVGEGIDGYITAEDREGLRIRKK